MRIISILLGVMFIANLATGQVKQVSGKNRITHVTLYRSQAMVSREVEVGNEKGELAILIEDLPTSIDPESLFATSDILKIRSVRFFTEYITNKVQKSELSNLKKHISDIEILKTKVQSERLLIASKKKFIEQLEAKYISRLGPSITPLTKTEIKVSGFDFKTIEKMTEFIFKRKEDLAKQSQVMEDKIRDFDSQIKSLYEKMSALQHGSSIATNNEQRQRLIPQNRKMLRKAMVYASKKDAKAAKLTLNYLVHNAGWSPTYNMRISDNANSLNLEYLAHVRQLTGEDWNQTKLTLSTATPNMNAELPILAPLWTRLVNFDNITKGASISDNRLMKNWKNQKTMNAKFQQRSFKSQSKVNYDSYNIDLNGNANDRQGLEFNTKQEILQRWYEGIRKVTQQIAVEYKIPDTITLASRKDNQMVQILTTSLNCKLYYEAIPLLSNYIFRGIEAINTINRPLLGGKYSAFIDGQYVGAGTLPLTVTGQTLSLGFGVDPQLKCTRELIDKTGDKSWGSRIETYKYLFTIDNFKSKQISIHLLDRIPVTKDKGLQITLKTGKDDLSKNKDYLKFDYTKGLLRWDLDLQPATSGSNATTLNYSFDMKFDSDMHISTKGQQIQQELKKDLNKLKMRRFKK